MQLFKLNEGNDPSLERIVKEFDKYYTSPSHAQKFADNLYGINYTNHYANGVGERLDIDLTCAVDTSKKGYNINVSIFYNDELVYRTQGELYRSYRDYEQLVTRVARKMDEVTKAQRIFKNSIRNHSIITYDLLNPDYREKLVKSAEKFQRTLDDIAY